MKPLVIFVAMALAIVVTGCSELKEDAIDAGVEILQLCKEKKNDQANARGVEMYEKNAVFKVAVDESAVVWKEKDIANYNYCGPEFITGHRKITEAKDPEGCGCHVVGASDRSRGSLWLLAAGLAVAVMRRRAS